MGNISKANFVELLWLHQRLSHPYSPTVGVHNLTTTSQWHTLIDHIGEWFER